MDEEIERRLRIVEERNQRVEGDKAWETSAIRKVLIAVLTYLIVAFYNWTIGGDAPALTALVPVAGYLLSALTIPFIKRRWLARRGAWGGRRDKQCFDRTGYLPTLLR